MRPDHAVGAPAGVGRGGPAGLPAAVLWDMDGTLVDTEQYWDDVTCALVEAHGGTWRAADGHALIGLELLASGRYIRERGGVDLTPEEIVSHLVAGVAERIREHLPWRPGARELLAALRAREVPCALVTMSYRVLAEAVVETLPAGSFAAVVAGDDVTHGKPHPEPYLLAAGRLGVDPAHCLAVEDSPTGLASAVAAGVPALGVEHLVPLVASPGRHLVDTLVGVTPDDLGTFAAGLRATG